MMNLLMKRRRTFVVSMLPRCGVSLLALGLVATVGTVSGKQIKQPSERDAGRIRRSAVFTHDDVRLAANAK
jgi:hypothetical protein